MWSKGKFVNRKFLMEELYQQHQLQKSTGNVICWGKKLRHGFRGWVGLGLELGLGLGLEVGLGIGLGSELVLGLGLKLGLGLELV